MGMDRGVGELGAREARGSLGRGGRTPPASKLKGTRNILALWRQTARCQGKIGENESENAHFFWKLFEH